FAQDPISVTLNRMTKRNAIGLAQSFDLRFDSLPSSAFNVNDTRRSCLSGLVPMADVPPEPSAYWIVSVQWAHCSPTEMEVRNWRQHSLFTSCGLWNDLCWN